VIFYILTDESDNCKMFHQFSFTGLGIKLGDKT